jgi:hypothetical protein
VGGIVAESKFPTDVTVWGSPEVFVQQTVVPGVTVTVDGVYPKLMTLI